MSIVSQEINRYEQGILMLKIIYSFGMDEFHKDIYNQKSVEDLSNDDYQIIFFDHRKYLRRMIYDAQILDNLFRDKDKNLFRTYEELEKLINESKADILLVGTDNVFHPEYLKKLDIYKVLMSSDDPIGSYSRTIPYLWSFDHVTCLNVLYHKNIPVKMTDKLLEWGAKRATWTQYGVADGLYNPNLTEKDIFNKNREIDILYVGAFYREKSEMLLKLKKEFGNRFKLYGKWGFKFFAYYLLKGKWVWVMPLSSDKFYQMYQNTKIGINIHLGGELGNGRLYHLPINGVMQICDCRNALSAVFEPGKEIVGYETIEELIELIKYYLGHDEERKNIAAAGFRKAINNYKYKDVFYKMLEEIKKGMVEDGIIKSNGIVINSLM